MFELSPGHRVRCLRYSEYPIVEGGQPEAAEVK